MRYRKRDHKIKRWSGKALGTSKISLICFFFSSFRFCLEISLTLTIYGASSFRRFPLWKKKMNEMQDKIAIMAIDLKMEKSKFKREKKRIPYVDILINSFSNVRIFFFSLVGIIRHHHQIWSIQRDNYRRTNFFHNSRRNWKWWRNNVTKTNDLNIYWMKCNKLTINR